MKRGKLFLISVVLGIFLIYAMIVILNVEPKYISYQNYVVQDGDSLWGIAEKHMPESDPRQVIFDIQQINGLPNDRFIQPGDELMVPVQIDVTQSTETMLADKADK